MIIRLALSLLIAFSCSTNLLAKSENNELMRLGQYDKAIEFYQVQLEHNPFNAMAANNLAVAYAMKREYSSALDWFRKAAKMDRGRKDISLNLETMEKWLASSGKNTNELPIPAAVSGPLSPEPPAPW